MNFAKFQQLVEERSGFRTMENPMATGEYFSDSCGDLYTYYLRIGPGERIEDISYFTTGCGFGTATCSLLVELAVGKTIDQAYAITGQDIENELDGYPQKKKDYPERSINALHAALDDYRAKRDAGKITDDMLEAARAAAPTHPVASSETGAVQSEAPRNNEQVTISLH